MFIVLKLWTFCPLEILVHSLHFLDTRYTVYVLFGLTLFINNIVLRCDCNVVILFSELLIVRSILKNIMFLHRWEDFS